MERENQVRGQGPHGRSQNRACGPQGEARKVGFWGALRPKTSISPEAATPPVTGLGQAVMGEILSLAGVAPPPQRTPYGTEEVLARSEEITSGTKTPPSAAWERRDCGNFFMLAGATPDSSQPSGGHSKGVAMALSAQCVRFFATICQA